MAARVRPASQRLLRHAGLSARAMLASPFACVMPVATGCRPRRDARPPTARPASRERVECEWRLGPSREASAARLREAREHAVPAYDRQGDATCCARVRSSSRDSSAPRSRCGSTTGRRRWYASTSAACMRATPAAAQRREARRSRRSRSSSRPATRRASSSSPWRWRTGCRSRRDAKQGCARLRARRRRSRIGRRGAADRLPRRRHGGGGDGDDPAELPAAGRSERRRRTPFGDDPRRCTRCASAFGACAARWPCCGTSSIRRRCGRSSSRSAGLRTCSATCAISMSSATKPWRARLGDGRAHDADPALAASLDELRKPRAGRRSAARRRAAIDSQRFTKLVLSVGRLATAPLLGAAPGTPGAELLAGPARTFASERFAKRHRKLRRAARDVDVAAAQRHALRVQAKKMRYASRILRAAVRGEAHARLQPRRCRPAARAGCGERCRGGGAHCEPARARPVTSAAVVRRVGERAGSGDAKRVERLCRARAGTSGSRRRRFVRRSVLAKPFSVDATSSARAPASRGHLSRAGVAARRPCADDLAVFPAAAAGRDPPRDRRSRPTATSGRSTGSMPSAEPAPLVVLFHGLEGSSESHYARWLFAALAARRWRGVVAHFRGCAGAPNRLPRAYHSGDHEEIEAMLRAIRSRGCAIDVDPRVRRLARRQRAAQLARTARRDAASIVARAAAVCAPLDLMAAGLAIDRGANRIYARNFLQTLKPKALAMAARFPGLLDAQRIRGARSMWDFDDVVTSRLHGFDGTGRLLDARLEQALACVDRRAHPRAQRAQRSVRSRRIAAGPRRSRAGTSRSSNPRAAGTCGFPTGPPPGRLDWLPARLLDFYAGFP